MCYTDVICSYLERLKSRPFPRCEFAPSDVGKLISYLTDHAFDETVTIEEALNRCNIHDQRISKRFEQWTGHSPSQFLEYRRLMAAAWLLCDEHIPVGEIARAVGYVHFDAFEQAFRRFVGCTPSEYRERTSGVRCAPVSGALA